MDEYISREETIETIRYRVCQGHGNKEHMCRRGSCAYCGIMEIMNDISSIEAADIQSVKHGQWVRGVSKGWPTKPSCLWYCSCCGEKIRYDDTLRTYQKIKKPVNEVNPYCRKCGARMDGDSDDKKRI